MFRVTPAASPAAAAAAELVGAPAAAVDEFPRFPPVGVIVVVIAVFVGVVIVVVVKAVVAFFRGFFFGTVGSKKWLLLVAEASVGPVAAAATGTAAAVATLALPRFVVVVVGVVGAAAIALVDGEGILAPAAVAFLLKFIMMGRGEEGNFQEPSLVSKKRREKGVGKEEEEEVGE